MAMHIPLNTPLQQQIDEFIAEGASWLPSDLLRDLLRPIGQLVTSGAAENALKERSAGPRFHAARRTRQRGEPLAPAQAGAGRRDLLSWPMVSILPSGAARLSAGRAAAAGRESYPRGDFPADAGPQPGFGGEAGTDPSALKRWGNQVARAYGLVFTIDKALRRAHVRVGADLPVFNGTNAWDLPIAATFLVAQSGTVHLAFVDPDFTRRLDPSVIVTRLNELMG